MSLGDSLGGWWIKSLYTCDACIVHLKAVLVKERIHGSLHLHVCKVTIKINCSGSNVQMTCYIIQHPDDIFAKHVY